MNLSSYIRRILKGDAPTPLYFFALAPFSLLYGLVVRVRAYMYRAGLLRVKTLPCRVISVGNLTAGGVGKTPMVIYLARRLAARGLKIAVLTRGYGGSLEGRTEVVSDGEQVLQGASEAGDEAVLLANSLPGAPVVMGRDRYRAGLLAMERFGPDAVILDDGYQHMALKRDLNLLLLDAARPFGNGFLLPVGCLREPPSAMKRADMVILTRADASTKNDQITKLAPSIPVIRAVHAAKSLTGLRGGEMGLERLSGARVAAVSGIADPSSFTLILQKLNATITRSFEYADHHVYGPGDLADIKAAVAGTGADMAVTTKKDAVKLATLETGGLELAVLGIEMEFLDGAEALEARLPGKT